MTSIETVNEFWTESKVSQTIHGFISIFCQVSFIQTAFEATIIVQYSEIYSYLDHQSNDHHPKLDSQRDNLRVGPFQFRREGRLNMGYGESMFCQKITIVIINQHNQLLYQPAQNGCECWDLTCPTDDKHLLVPNISRANCLANQFYSPVGPTKRKLPIDGYLR